MTSVLTIADLARSERAHEFEGGAYGAPLSLFLIDTAPQARPALHRHPYAEVFVIQAGRAQFTADDASIDAQAGQIVVVPAGVAHTYVAVGHERLQMLGIHAQDHFITEWLEP